MQRKKQLADALNYAELRRSEYLEGKDPRTRNLEIELDSVEQRFHEYLLECCQINESKAPDLIVIGEKETPVLAGEKVRVLRGLQEYSGKNYYAFSVEFEVGFVLLLQATIANDRPVIEVVSDPDEHFDITEQYILGLISRDLYKQMRVKESRDYFQLVRQRNNKEISLEQYKECYGKIVDEIDKEIDKLQVEL